MVIVLITCRIAFTAFFFNYLLPYEWENYEMKQIISIKTGQKLDENSDIEVYVMQQNRPFPKKPQMVHNESNVDGKDMHQI